MVLLYQVFSHKVGVILVIVLAEDNPRLSPPYHTVKLLELLQINPKLAVRHWCNGQTCAT